MSLSSFLLKADVAKDKGKSIDTSLDQLFKSNPVASKPTEPKAAPSTAAGPSKTVKDAEVKQDKKRKHVVEEQSPAKAKKSKRESTSSAAPAKPTTQPKPSSSKTKPTGLKKQPPKPQEDESSSDNEDAQDEESARPPEDAEDEADSDEEGDPTKLVHESVAVNGKSKTASGKTKYVPPEETPEQRDARTVFVGNVPVEVVKSNPMKKQFNRHILSFVPDAKIESVRFRSVAFQKPTTELPSDAASSSKTKPKEGRQHDRDRAASWRASKGKDGDEDAEPTKTFLTPKEKKRIAFIKQEIHSGVDSVNAYVVFAHPVPVENRPKNLPPPRPVMDPYEAAKAVIKAADGSVFMGRTIRLDSAVKGKGKAQEIVDAEMLGDPKATVFVGNLDFAAKEEDVRAFFEGLIVTERGEPTQAQAEDAERGGRKAWVKRVRLIRDKDTLLGKGFGYVQFVDRECVDEILALEQDRLKFAKRKLRVQRCKTLPGAPKIAPAKPAAPQKGAAQAKGASQSRPRPAAPAPVPKGDPALGEKLAGLTKDERKKLKATDADRVARRLAKKKAKALADKGVKARESTKERTRERKRPKDKGSAPEKSKSKKRVRSNKALAKMNTKK